MMGLFQVNNMLLEIAEMETRKAMVSALAAYTPRHEAEQLRIDLALRKGRTVAQLAKWLHKIESWYECETVERDELRIGNEMGFIKRGGSSRNISFSQCYGDVVIIHAKSVIVWYRGETERVSL